MTYFCRPTRKLASPWFPWEKATRISFSPPAYCRKYPANVYYPYTFSSSRHSSQMNTKTNSTAVTWLRRHHRYASDDSLVFPDEEPLALFFFSSSLLFLDGSASQLYWECVKLIWKNTDKSKRLESSSRGRSRWVFLFCASAFNVPDNLSSPI